MSHRILITGSSGLIGSAIIRELQSRGQGIERLDIAATGRARGDVRDAQRVHDAVSTCDGVIHLAAVSRVISGEEAPDECRETNIGGLRNVLEAVAVSARHPWIIFASSREVYGQPEQLPVNEDCPLSPINVYGHTKVEGERLVEAARRDGVRACTVRLSNAYGSIDDHTDRVVPAFARLAVLGQQLRVDGAEHTFDFTHIDDVASGLWNLVELLAENGPPPPPIHFVSGAATTLAQLAALAIRFAGTRSTIRHATPRNFDVSRFVGSHDRAKQILGWTPQVSLQEGLKRLIFDFRSSLESPPVEEDGS